MFVFTTATHRVSLNGNFWFHHEIHSATFENASEWNYWTTSYLLTSRFPFFSFVDSSHHHQFDFNQRRVIVAAIRRCVEKEIYGIASGHQWNRMEMKHIGKSSWNSFVFGNGTGRIHGLNLMFPCSLSTITYTLETHQVTRSTRSIFEVKLKLKEERKKMRLDHVLVFRLNNSIDVRTEKESKRMKKFVETIHRTQSPMMRWNFRFQWTSIHKAFRIMIFRLKERKKKSAVHWWGSSALEIQSENCRLKLLFLLHRSRRWPQRSWWNVSAIRFYENVFPTATVHCTLWRRLTVHPCAKKLFSMLASVERIKSLILCQFEFLVLFLRFNVITNGRTDDGTKNNAEIR